MTKQKVDPIPDFTNYQEEAEFWDTHSLADYQDQLKRVDVQFGKNLTEGITVRFDPQTLDKLRTEAQKKGLGPTTLARMWILERLQTC